MAVERQLRLLVITPETTVLDQPVQAVRFPLYDGQFGVLPGRAPVVGRLGYGELKVTTADGERSYFIDGGFVQVKGLTVTLLTSRSLAAEELDLRQAEQELEAVLSRRAVTETERVSKEQDLERARRLVALARKVAST